MTLSNWLIEEAPDMNAELAMDFLSDYLLNENYSEERSYALIVFNILSRYSKKFKKELRVLRRHKK